MQTWFPYIIGFSFAATPWCSSALALVLGMLLSLGAQVRAPDALKKYGRYMMQIAIVAMGFAMDPNVVIQSGAKGVVVTLVTLGVALGAGLVLARLLRIEGTTGVLISAGTGICGGSAIASMAPVLRSKHEEVAVAMATVFCLNAVALFVFPALGRSLQLSPEQFGWFSAIAIHDTSSVVGAATEFHPDAVPIAVTGKLTRALWIIPMVLITALAMRWKHRQSDQANGKIQWPWFIGVFVLAVILHAALPPLPELYKTTETLGKAVLKMAIFAIGAQLTRQTIRAVGPRAMALGVILWLIMSTITLAWVKAQIS